MRVSVSIYVAWTLEGGSSVYVCERWRDRQRERTREYVCMHACMYVCLYIRIYYKGSNLCSCLRRRGVYKVFKRVPPMWPYLRTEF